jgi:hypothetical protein
MSRLRTRREVLTMAGAGVAGLAVARPVAGQSPQSGVGLTDIRVFRTYGDKRWTPEPPIRWQAGGDAGTAAIRLDPART